MARSKWLVNSSASRFHDSPASNVDFRPLHRARGKLPSAIVSPLNTAKTRTYLLSIQSIKIHFANFALLDFSLACSSIVCKFCGEVGRHVRCFRKIPTYIVNAFAALLSWFISVNCSLCLVQHFILSGGIS